MFRLRALSALGRLRTTPCPLPSGCTNTSEAYRRQLALIGNLKKMRP